MTVIDIIFLVLAYFTSGFIGSVLLWYSAFRDEDFVVFYAVVFSLFGPLLLVTATFIFLATRLSTVFDRLFKYEFWHYVIFKGKR